MPKKRHIDYQCVRCGYKTNDKTKMKRHLTNNKKPCPATLNKIELTDELRQEILTNRMIKSLAKTKVNATELTLRNGSVQSTDKKQKKETKCKESINQKHNVELATIANVPPLAKTTACGQPVWVLYAHYNDNRAPIRTIIENGQRKIHLFDFIKALTDCDDNVRNEWRRLQNGLKKAIVTKITIAQKYQFPQLDRNQLAKSNSMVIDIFQAAEVASMVGKRAQWFTDILLSLGNRFMAGDLDLMADVEYMNIAQQLIQDHDPDNFLRLWGEEFVHKTQTAQHQKGFTNPEQIVGSTTGEVKTVMDRANITRTSLNRSQPRVRYFDQTPDCIGILYTYLLIPRFDTREEAMGCLEKRGIRIKPDHPAIICKNDLKGRFLLKVGKTESLPENRQIDYTRALKELYVEDEEHLREYLIKFIAKLSDVETKVKRAVFTKEKVGLIRDNGTTYYPKEVFLVDSVEEAGKTVERVIKKAQMESENANRSNDGEMIRIECMREKTRQLELKVKMLEHMERMDAKDDVIKMILASGLSDIV